MSVIVMVKFDRIYVQKQSIHLSSRSSGGLRGVNTPRRTCLTRLQGGVQKMVIGKQKYRYIGLDRL